MYHRTHAKESHAKRSPFKALEAFPPRKFKEKVSLFPTVSLKLISLVLPVYMASLMDLAEAKKLIAEGFRP